MRMSRMIVTGAAAGALAVVAGCGSTSGGGSTGAAPTSAAPTSAAATSSAASLSGTVTVLAAASLTGTFTDLGKQFEAAHPGVTVRFSFGASSALAQQINAGAPADVFASASTKNMTQVASHTSNPTTFVKNEAEIAVPPSNPKKITDVADLARSGVKVALCQAQVPCGVVAQAVFTKTRTTVKPVTLGADVKSVLTTVELNEADAGVVYKTDVQAAGSKVKGIAIPENENASTAYPIATVTGSKNAAAAAAFVAYVLSPAGRTVLTEAGFAQP